MNTKIGLIYFVRVEASARLLIKLGCGMVAMDHVLETVSRAAEQWWCVIGQ